MSIKRTYIIAEIGNNHEGNFSIARKLIILAKKAGVDAVKFQSYNTENFINPSLKKSFKRLKKFELDISEFKKLKLLARKLKLNFISTPLDLYSFKKINSFLDVIKIASSDNNFFYLIEQALRTKKKVIISLGLADKKLLKTIRQKVLLLCKRYRVNKKNVSFLHCITNYPVRDEHVNLNAITYLKKFFKTFDVGYSDHSIGNEACIAAVSLGANIIEKHFTIDKNFSSFRDHKLSADYFDMQELVKSVRKIELQLGKSEKIINQTEKNYLKILRRAAYARKNIKKNKKINYDDIVFQRPWSANSTLDLKKLLGRKVIRNLKKNEPIKIKYLK